MESGDHSELLALAAQQIEEPQVVRLHEHLEVCSRCREFVGRQQAVWQALDIWDPPAISNDFDQRLFRRIEQRASWWDRYWPVQHWVPIAAAACLIVVAGWVSSRPAGVAPLPQAQAAQLQNLQPEQVEHVLDDMQMLSDFTRATRSDAGEL
jgi:hypothetical protein